MINIHNKSKIKKINYIILFVSSIIIIHSLNSIASAKNLVLLGSLAETYDDNTNNSTNDQKDDYITDITLGVGINLEGKTQTLQFLGHSIQRLYYKQSNLNSIKSNSQDFILNYKKEFSSRDAFSLNDSFQHYPEPQNFQTMFTQPGGRNVFYQNSMIISYNKNITEDLLFNLHYNNVIIENSNKNFQDSMLNGAGFSLNYSLNAFNIVSVLYDYKITTFEHTNTENNNQGDITQHNAGMGYQHFFTKQLSFLGQGGIEYINSQDQTNKNPFITLSIIDNIDPKNTINVTISRSYQISSTTNTIYDSWLFSTMFTRQVSDIVNFSLNIFYGYGSTVSAITKSNTTLFGINTIIQYYLNSYIFVSTKYIYTKNILKSTEPYSPKIEYDRNQIQVAVNAEY